MVTNLIQCKMVIWDMVSNYFDDSGEKKSEVHLLFPYNEFVVIISEGNIHGKREGERPKKTYL